jgi:hypothetical protein
VAPTLIADGGRVPWAGEFDSRDVNDNRLSPNPLLSSSSCTGLLRLFDRVERDDLGVDNVFDTPVDADCASRSDARVRGVFVTGVRFLIDGTGMFSWLSLGSAPVIVKSAPSCGAGCHASLRRDRVALITSPSLSSLKVSSGSRLAAACIFVGCFLRGAACVGFDVVATRPTLDATLALFGRGIVGFKRVGCELEMRIGAVE